MHLTGTRGDFDKLVAEHQSGKDVSGALRAALGKALPSGQFAASSQDGRSLQVLHEAGSSESWRHIKISDPAKFKPGVILPGRYTRHGQAQFNLVEGEGSRIAKVKWVKNDRLLVRLNRDETGRFYDRGTKYQDLELHFDAAGKVSALAVANHGRGGWLGKTKLEVNIAKKTRANDMVHWLGGKSDGTTTYRK